MKWQQLLWWMMTHLFPLPKWIVQLTVPSVDNMVLVGILHLRYFVEENLVPTTKALEMQVKM